MEDSDFTELIARKGQRDSCIPIFHYQAMLDTDATETAGKNIFKDVPFVEIIIPGNAKERVVRPVEEIDKQRWPDKWKKFMDMGPNGRTVEIDGTPIEEWPQATPGQVKTLKSNDVPTVEALAGMADIHLQGLGMGMSELRRKAQVYVGLKNDEVKIQKVAAENNKLKTQITGLEKLLGEMQSRIEELERDHTSDRHRTGARDKG